MGSGQRGKCAGCGKFFLADELTIDHKIPISKGGSWHFQNLQLMCYKCNQKKGDTFSLEELFNAIKQEQDDTSESGKGGREVDAKRPRVRKPKGKG